MSPITQSEFDQLATFVAVADELSLEPFISQDNHDKLVQLKDANGHPCFAGYFCRPVFLKSALLPFRKLWLESEPCEFKKIRDLVFRAHPDQNELSGYRPWFYEMYSAQLAQPAAPEWAKESRRDILNIWIYTQAMHAGKKETRKGPWGKFTLQDFDAWAERIGCEKFEFLFRSSLRTVAGTYVQFLRKIAQPFFVLLQRDYKMIPGFEAAAALKYRAYPDPQYQIIFDDVFWHLDKESMEETFDRLLERGRFDILRSFFRAYCQGKAEAIALLREHSTFTAMLERTGAVQLKENESVADAQPLCQYSSAWGSSYGPIKFRVYPGRRIDFSDGGERIFARAYASFRQSLFEERKRQRPEASSDNSW
jgi:hypothetical protein